MNFLDKLLKKFPKYYVYIISNHKNSQRYVGSRVCYDKDPLNDGYWGSSDYLNGDIEKYGIENFFKTILGFHDSKEEMLSAEVEAIIENNTLYPNGYNRFLPPNKFNTIGISIKEIWIKKYGKEVAEQKYIDWKRRESESHTGENNSFFGKLHTEETKERIRRKQTGKKYSAEVNKKKGRIKVGSENGMFGRVWITNEELNDNKIIESIELQKYIENGWTKGRKNYKLQRT